jgi:hypothetical protein
MENAKPGAVGWSRVSLCKVLPATVPVAMPPRSAKTDSVRHDVLHDKVENAGRRADRMI